VEPEFQQFIAVNGKFFQIFMNVQAAFAIILAALVGTVQGGTQALSRSLFASMIPQHKSGEFFGFFSVFDTTYFFGAFIMSPKKSPAGIGSNAAA
jgi:MFS-type transporter involved in bile tolerance (Atg22 family)